MSGVEIAVIGAVASAAATVAEGYAQYQQGKSEKKAYDTNAEILRRNAAQKRLETSMNEDLVRSENRRRVSAARAAMGEAGMLDSATAIGALGQMAAQEEQNALNLRFAGESEASNYMNQALLQNYYGKVAKANGKNAFKMSFLTGGMNGLSTYSSMDRKFGGNNIRDVTGTAGTGGNVRFTNASYKG